MRRDEGTSLVELMVGMVLMTIFLAMFTGAIVLMTSAMKTSQAVNSTASTLTGAYLNLDNTVRYADHIGGPRKDERSGDWSVVLRTTTTGSEVCTQLRVQIASQQLQRRSWTVVGPVADRPSAWVPIASDISNGAAAAGSPTQPFSLPPTRDNAAFQQLTITLVSPSGSGSSRTTSSSTFTFTAVNSVLPPSTDPICRQPGSR